ncbi:MAG: tetraacyldisaccharide 4'-kinase [Ignavibacteriae bacterium]|nr:tetraacyldisaccharide 4'-kinase [Ignavibacteriota bacterium]
MLSWLYSLVVAGRNKAFDLGVLRTTRVAVPVIAVGNLTVGGTRKTPLVEYLADYCLKKRRVAIISRGYKRRSKGVVVVSDGKSVKVDAMQGGDEPVQMARKFPAACVVVGESRVEAAAVAIQDLDAELLLLDDGFQHRYLARDLDIVVLDVERDILPGLLLPAGRMREPWSALRRANVVVWSKMETHDEALGLEERLSSWYSGPIVKTRYAVRSLRRAIDSMPVEADRLKDKKAIAFSGVGDHDGFVRTLKTYGFRIAGEMRFRDHHTYDSHDVESVAALLHRTGAEICLTTEKDAVRLAASPSIMNAIEELYFPQIVVEIIAGEEQLLAMVDACLEKGVN